LKDETAVGFARVLSGYYEDYWLVFPVVTLWLICDLDDRHVKATVTCTYAFETHEFVCYNCYDQNFSLR
jgi:hypothetical protein